MNTDRLENWLVICLAIAFPWHSQVRLSFASVNMSLGDPVVVLIGLLLLVGIFRLNVLPSFSKFILGFLIVVVMSTVIAIFRYPALTNPISGISEIAKMVASVTYFFAIIILFSHRTREKIYSFSLVTAIVTAAFSMWTIIENILGFHRPSGPFENPNLFADYLLLAFFSIWYLLDQNNYHIKNKYNKYFILLIPLVFISLVGTESRSAVVSILIGIGTVLLIKYRTYLKKIEINPSSILLPLAVVISTVIVLLYSEWRIFQRFEALLSDGGDTGGRFDRWFQSLEVLFDSSLLGVGWGQHPQHLVGTSRFIHNSLIQATVDSGIIAGLLLIALWIFVIRRGLQLSLIKGSNYPVYITAFILASVVNSMFHNNLNFRTFWIGIGLIGVLELYYVNRTISSNDNTF